MGVKESQFQLSAKLFRHFLLLLAASVGLCRHFLLYLALPCFFLMNLVGCERAAQS